MTELNFPLAPTTGQVFDRWTFDGQKWNLTPEVFVTPPSGGSDGFTYVTDVEPTVDLKVGQTWYDTSTGNSYVYIENLPGGLGDWVQFASSSGNVATPWTLLFNPGAPVTGGTIDYRKVGDETQMRFSGYVWSALHGLTPPVLPAGFLPPSPTFFPISDANGALRTFRIDAVNGEITLVADGGTTLTFFGEQSISTLPIAVT